ncbi:3-oxoacyl-[acyl-carrier-protein] reductase [Pseudoduganella ginsengisoli]|uniref:Glucose 1-dehydrogenase n=1 Tax=Pseudoduganella ginsengisoli TaxID=1462440 RepID=A0A6L6PST3_9BURK|nr:SDR family NAD(P)-dependent oxidoreductase [Pseudoduganella ginsengisoli]MTW00497.1 glucose 1-dehydrogenase [Pseudoduganella ginsengisoli]
MLLKNKTAIVTGSSRGIGKEILRVFAENGANLFACARKETEEFTRDLAELAERTGVAITPVYFDLTDSEQVKAGVRTIISTKQKVDVLVNNAGVATGSFFQMASLPDMKNVFEVNFFSQLLFSQGISRYMARSKAGSIINIASTAGLVGDAGMTSYGSSKAALMFATKTMATELGESGIRANAIAPNVTRTDMYDQMEEKARDKLIASTALKRPAEPVEIANVALFLASDLSSYVTGQVLRVDGGQI